MRAKAITIPAAVNGHDGVYVERLDSSGFGILSAGAPFKVNVPHEGPRLVSSGDSVGTETGNALGRVEFLNSLDSALDVVIGDFGTARQIIQQPALSTYPKGTEIDCGTPAVIIFPGIDSAGRERKVFYITNTDATAVARVFLPGSVGQNPVAPNAYVASVYPKSTLALESNATFWVDSAAANCLIRVLEVFYAKVTTP